MKNTNPKRRTTVDAPKGTIAAYCEDLLMDSSAWRASNPFIKRYSERFRDVLQGPTQATGPYRFVGHSGTGKSACMREFLARYTILDANRKTAPAEGVPQLDDPASTGN